MRASPVFQISVHRFGVWRAGLLMLLIMTVMVWGTWIASREFVSAPSLAGSVMMGVGICAVAASLLRCTPFSLRWDGQRWHLGPITSVGEEPSQGQLIVAFDLGGWMLLKFEHNVRSVRRPVHWLPMQRRGLESQWHALRCAVYCARPEPVRIDGVLNANSQELQE